LPKTANDVPLVARVILFGSVDPAVTEHLKRWLPAHFRWCRENGIAVPADLRALFDQVASGGQGVTRLASDHADTDDGGMHLLALDYRQVALRLGGVSERSVRRLVDGGVLQSVVVAGCPRVRSTDLAAYVQQLETR
jgi:GAF domain-containing protein